MCLGRKLNLWSLVSLFFYRFKLCKYIFVWVLYKSINCRKHLKIKKRLIEGERDIYQERYTEIKREREREDAIQREICDTERQVTGYAERERLHDTERER